LWLLQVVGQQDVVQQQRVQVLLQVLLPVRVRVRRDVLLVQLVLTLVQL
jgi:hypothetical protein